MTDASPHIERATTEAMLRDLHQDKPSVNESLKGLLRLIIGELTERAMPDEGHKYEKSAGKGEAPMLDYRGVAFRGSPLILVARITLVPTTDTPSYLLEVKLRTKVLDGGRVKPHINHSEFKDHVEQHASTLTPILIDLCRHEPQAHTKTVAAKPEGPPDATRFFRRGSPNTAVILRLKSWSLQEPGPLSWPELPETAENLRQLIQFYREAAPAPTREAEMDQPRPNPPHPSLMWTLALSRNLILEGVPGTGKTHAIKGLQAAWNTQADAADPNQPKRFRKIDDKGIFIRTMHPATTYEDFIGGLQPNKDGNFAYTRGFFLKACDYARSKPDEDVLVVLDEFNRCNVPKVMGDLLTVLEPSKRATRDKDKLGFTGGTTVKLPGGAHAADSIKSQRDSDDKPGELTVPENILVLATMNTTDRSVAPLDAALRRRFAFHRMWPLGFDPHARMNATAVARAIWKQGAAPSHFTDTVGAWHALNSQLEKHGNDALLGHSYLFALRKDLVRQREGRIAPAIAVSPQDLIEHHWNQHLLPALSETLMSNRLAKGAVVDAILQPVKAHGLDIQDDRPAGRRDNLHPPILRLQAQR